MSSPAFNNFLLFLRRYLFSAVSGIVAIVFLGAAGYLLRDLHTLELRHQLRSTEGEEVLATVAAGPQLREELAAVRKAVKRIDDNLVTETNLAENSWYFYKFEEKTKAHLSDLHQLTTPPIDSDSPYKLISYSLRVTGSYAQVAAFLQELEAGPRPLLIRSFSFGRSGDPAESAALNLDLTLDLLGKK